MVPVAIAESAACYGRTPSGHEIGPEVADDLDEGARVRRVDHDARPDDDADVVVRRARDAEEHEIARLQLVDRRPSGTCCTAHCEPWTMRHAGLLPGHHREAGAVERRRARAARRRTACRAALRRTRPRAAHRASGAGTSPMTAPATSPVRGGARRRPWRPAGCGRLFARPVSAATPARRVRRRPARPVPSSPRAACTLAVRRCRASSSSSALTRATSLRARRRPCAGGPSASASCVRGSLVLRGQLVLGVLQVVEDASRRWAAAASPYCAIAPRSCTLETSSPIGSAFPAPM